MIGQRLKVFIDAQNVRNGARNAFFENVSGHISGQIDPIKYARLLIDRSNRPRILAEVRIYTGRPESGRDPRTYAAHMKQCATWTRAGATVITRTLKYPPDWPETRAQEKGVDVALAVDLVAGAVQEEYDAAVVASTDTDLLPAIEFVYNYKGPHGPSIEVSAWHSHTSSRELRITGPGWIWCHRLNLGDYLAVEDTTDYAR